MNIDPDLRLHSPANLAGARAVGHRIVQFLTKAARANLLPEPDDSHSNLGWDRDSRQFFSQPITAAGQTVFATASVWPLTLGLKVGAGSAALPLEGVSVDDASAWLDTELGRNGLNVAAAVETPYELPAGVAAVEVFRPAALEAGLRALSSWFDLADGLLSAFAKARTDLTPGPSPVRCWPHHFDIATYVSLERGDAETARGIGVGMSPGDDNYEQPYFYVNPWPQVSADGLPSLPAPAHWHTEGFVGAIATAERTLDLDDPRAGLAQFLDDAFAAGVTLLGK